MRSCFAKLCQPAAMPSRSWDYRIKSRLCTRFVLIREFNWHPSCQIYDEVASDIDFECRFFEIDGLRDPLMHARFKRPKRTKTPLCTLPVRIRDFNCNTQPEFGRLWLRVALNTRSRQDESFKIIYRYFRWFKLVHIDSSGSPELIQTPAIPAD